MKLLQRFLKSEDGNVLIITGASLLMLMGVSGAGVDLGRQQLLRAKIQQASDAASIAASTLPEGTTNAAREDMARRYFRLNFPAEYMGLARPNPSVSATDSGVVVSATANMPTRFIGFVGVDTMQSTGRSVVGKNVVNSELDFDVVAVIDESGSTSAAAPGGGGTRMEVEKAALRSMIEGLYPTGKTPNPKVRFGMIGYTGYISNKWGLSSDPAHAQTAINNLRPVYQNYDHYGLEAGLQMIRGNWTAGVNNAQVSMGSGTVQRNITVPSSRTARPDGKQLSDARHIVFLTDGYIMVEPPPCYGGGGSGPCPNYPVFLTQCDAIKAAGVTLYTISFASQTPGDSGTLKACASKDASGQPRYFFAPNSTVLRQVLGSVGETIRSIRITE